MSLPFARQAVSRQTVCIRQARISHHRSVLRSQYPICACSRRSYATAAAPVERPDEQQQRQQQQSRHVILPNPALEAFRISNRVLPSSIAEQFAILNACIRSGSMDRAERIMKELYRTRLEEMKVFADLHIYNSFLNGFAVTKPKPMTTECLAWFDKMRTYDLTPDADSYAILVKAYLRAESYHLARSVLSEMQQESGLTLSDMLKSKYLADTDVHRFRTLISESRGSKSAEVQKLLNDLEVATADVFGKPSTSESPVAATETMKPITLVDESVPEVKPTDSIGVKFLQEQLAALRDPQKVAKMDPYELQMALEEQGYEVAMQRLLHMKEASMERGDVLTAMNLTPLKKIMWEWHEQTVPLIKAEIEKCDNTTKRDTERRIYGPFLKLLKPETLSMITMLELLRLHNSSGIADGMKTARAVIDVGKAVEMEYNAIQLKKMSSRRSARNMEIHNLFSSGKLFNMAVRRAQMEMLRKQESAQDTLESSSEGDTGVTAETGEWTPVWPSSIRAKVGSVLTSIFIDAAKIPVPSRDPETGEKIIEHIPAFFHTYQYVYGKRVGIIKFSEPLTNLLSREPVRDTLHPRHLPMIVHPRPWLSYNSGGYLSSKTSCMRIKDSPEQLVYLHKASEQDRLVQVLAGLDVLGSTRWRVNRNVFNVVLEAWNSGQAIADIPPAIDEPAPLPPKPENYDTDPKAKFNWVSLVRKITQEERNRHSLRCDVNYKVETARAFLNLPMYFPHNMDFRGRAYPIPPTLNHLGNDLCRGLLMFDEGKPLGESGWRWLKIHLANLYGYDKYSFSEREAFTVEHMEDILDSVDRPLTGKRWWLTAESPWQCLAACYEVAAAYRSGKPHEFISHIPIHQDGTCNGLQHYAALGGDMAGAQAVNLAPSDRPADVYTGVAMLVEKLVEQDAKEGNEDAQLLVGKISRKLVKQTVMTNVYGVTYIGARAQIESRLREMDDIPREKIYSLAGYVAKKVFASLGEMFNGARKIQDWLTDSARRIARSIPEEALQEAGVLPKPDGSEASETGSGLALPQSKRKRPTKKGSRGAFSARNPTANQMTSVIWTTPLGLPIVQPYRRTGKKQVSTILQTVFIEDPDASRPVNAMKQSTAFPPNFIHSLDATHMLMSAVACHEKGLTFASVHDSYWTHACNVDEMNKIIRDQFIELHSQPIMENLLKEFQERYKNYKVPVMYEVDQDDPESMQDVSQDPKGKLSAYGFADPAIVNDELKKGSSAKDRAEKDAMEALFGGYDEDDTDEPSDAVAAADMNGGEEMEEEEAAAPRKKKKRGGVRKFKHTWEDLTFLPLPEKGEFDINQVKNSDYFFH